MIFVIPEHKTVDVKRISVSYLLSALCGIAAAMVAFGDGVGIFIAVFASMVLMTYLKLEHPPAIGVSISAVLSNSTPTSLISIMIALLVLFIVFALVKILSYFLTPHKKTKFTEYIKTVEKELGI